MPTRVSCSGCGKQFAIADDQAKKQLPNCPQCGAPLQSKTLVARPVHDESASILDELLKSDPGARRPMPRPMIAFSLEEKRADFNWKPWAIGGGGLLAALFVGLIASSIVGSATKREDHELKMKIRAENAIRAAEGSKEDPSTSSPVVAFAAPATKTRQATRISPNDDDASVTVLNDAATDAKADPSKPSDDPPEEEKKKDKPRVKMSVADLIDAVGDGVVHITAHDADGEPFATGSGFIVARHKVDEWLEPDGKATDQTKPMKGDLWLVATNYHVVAGGTSMKVRMRDGTTFEARGLAAMSRERDLAILALDQAPKNLTILDPAPEGTFRQGEDVVAIGHPKGFDFTVSTGIISAVRGTENLPEEIAESIEAPADQQWIQTTAAITNGNSGGPLLTMFGEVVGINTWGINSGGNLSFASHVKHMVDLQKTAIEKTGKLTKVKTISFVVAKPVEAPEKIGDRDNWLESEVREELTRSTIRARTINWRPATKGDYTTFQAAATMLTICALYRYDADEIKLIDDAVRKRTWEFAKEVETINRYSVEHLEQKVGGVVVFGTVRRINPAVRRKLWIDLTGRGHVIAVTIPTNQPAPKLDVGDGVCLFGYCIGAAPENSQLNREVPHVLAGLITKTELPSVPEDTALQAAYDLGRHNRHDQGFEENVRRFANAYPRVIPLIGKTGVRWQRIELNARGRQFDAVRFSVPPELHPDMLWTFNDPDASIESWSVMPVDNFPMYGDPHHITLTGQTVIGLTKAESAILHVDAVADNMIVPNEDYLLWFAFKDSQPRKVSISVRLVPTGSFEQKDTESIGTAMRDGIAFKSEDLARMTKALKEAKEKSLAQAKPSADLGGDANEKAEEKKTPDAATPADQAPANR